MIVKDRRAKPIEIPLDTTGFAIPKPAPRVKAQPKDGRRIESSREYSANKRSMWERQHRRCVRVRYGKVCNAFMPSPAYGHRHHPGGRGIGGSKRDDSKTVLWCIECHLEEHQ